MAQLPPDNTIFVVFEYRAGDGLSSAFFEWPIEQPIDSYSIAVAGLRLSLDAHIPARPIQVDMENDAQVDSPAIEVLQQLFGIDFAETMRQIRETKFMTATLELNRDNREALARVQLDDAASPEIIQEGCRSMLRETAASDETAPEATAAANSWPADDVLEPPPFAEPPLAS